MNNKEDLNWEDGYAIAEWLLAHKEGLQTIIKTRYASQGLFPEKDLPEAYTEGVLNIIKREIEQSLQLNPEIINLTLTPKFIIMVYGEEFFKR